MAVYVAIFNNDENTFPLQVINKPDIDKVTVLPDEAEVPGLRTQVSFMQLEDFKEPIAKKLVEVTELWHWTFGCPDNIAEYVMALLNKLKEESSLPSTIEDLIAADDHLYNEAIS